MKVLHIIAEVLAVFACIATFLPYIRTDQWWVRILDFPRMQLMLFIVGALAIYAVLFQQTTVFDHVLVALLVISAVIQIWHIYPYTIISSKQVKDASGNGVRVKVFVANVLQENRQSDKLLEEVVRAAPDIVLLTETDDWWTERMQKLKEHLPHTILHPMSNTYGMNLYSRFKLSGSEVRTLIDTDVPSIRTNIMLRDRRTILFYGVHPLPPGIKHPRKDERQDSDKRDAELVVIAKEVADLKAPIIIAGDFNDVAWSHTTRLFQRTSRLLDPRVGRGFFNSFNAKSYFWRFPLDHLFHSDHFTLVDLQRRPYFGSDHYPIHVELNLQPMAEVEQEAPDPKENDDDEADQMLKRV